MSVDRMHAPGFRTVHPAERPVLKSERARQLAQTLANGGSKGQKRSRQELIAELQKNGTGKRKKLA